METLRYVVLANGLLAVVSIAFYVLLRRETFFEANRLVLWLGLTASLVLPLLELPDWRPQPVRAVMQRTARVIVPKVLPRPPASQPDVTITFPNGRTYPAFPSQVIRAGWSWQQGLLGLYVAVLIFLLGRFGVRLGSLMRLIRQSTQEPYDDFTLVRNTSVTSPFSFFGWVVLNPDHHTPDELEQILRHERVHVRAWHSVDMIGAELVRIVFWFNPAAYLFRQLVHQTLEFSADRIVLAEGVDVKLYQYNLVKVSLSTGPSGLTNHFSESQLKSRIIMLSKPKSSRTTWLKYPVLVVALLTVVATFARPGAQTLKKIVPAHVAETVALVVNPAEDVTIPSPTVEAPVQIDAIRQAHAQASKLETDVPPSVAVVDSVHMTVGLDSAPQSPSRYIMYQGDYLYWIVTPSMSLDDFMTLKQELSKYGCQLRLNELKYDPLHAYIERLAFSVIERGGFRDNVIELDQANRPAPASSLNQANRPVPTIAGYLIHSMERNHKDHAVWANRLDGRFSPKFPLYQTPGEVNFPVALRTVAAEDEAAVAQFIAQKRMDYLILEGERKYGPLGIGFRKFNGEKIKKESGRGGFIKVNPDGLLSVDRAKNSTKVFINNEPVSHADIQHIKVSQLHTVAVVLGYDNSTQKRSGTDYWVFYVNEDN